MDNPFELILVRLAAIEKLLTDLSKNNRDKHLEHETYPEFVNITQASQFLDVAKQTIYGLTAGRKIPHYKQGKRIYFKRQELVEWILKNRVKTKEEIEGEAINYIVKKRHYHQKSKK